MKKDDFKAIIAIFFMLLVISAIFLLGINIYLKIIENKPEIPLYEGNTTITPNEESKKEAIVSQIEEIFNKIQNVITGKPEEEPSTNENEMTQDIPTNTIVQTEGYYYSQLNSYSKIIYNKLKENKENLKTGTYKINFGQEFNQLLEQESGAKLLQEYYQSAMETFLYDNPDVFYLEPTKMYINIQTTRKVFSTIYEVYIDKGENINYFANGFISKEQIAQYENEIQQVTANILAQVSGKNDYEKMLFIHDYLVDNVSYDQSISRNNIYNMYGALVSNEAVCEGYAKAFKYLMDEVGIESIVVIGDAKDSEGNAQSHAWNYVKFNGNWYAIDVTWDDPIIRGIGILTKKHKYKYFLKGSETMDVDHTVSITFVENGRTYEHPILSIKDYK